MGQEISKRYSCLPFHPISAQLHEDIGHYEAIQAITFLGNQKSFFFLNMAYRNFNMAVKGNNYPKILTIADCSAKRTKNWDLWFLMDRIRILFLVLFFEFTVHVPMLSVTMLFG